jgi:hypothetical protein
VDQAASRSQSDPVASQANERHQVTEQLADGLGILLGSLADHTALERPAQIQHPMRRSLPRT